MDEMNIVYVLPDVRDRITAISSDAFLTDPTDWIEIDRGAGDRYYHAQGNYLSKPIYTEEGIPRYKLADGVPVERTAEEIAADIAALPQPEPSEPVEDELADAIAALELLGVTPEEGETDG